MSNNRHTRNPQQLRALIQNMGRSIDEARQRRVGPEQGVDAASTASGSQPDAVRSSMQPPSNASTAAGTQTPSGATTPPPAPHQMAPHMPPHMPPSSPPPIRSATEMFSESTPRLKARPKRAS
jgi:hypothetical protein